jgi:hypothetical protein
VVVDGPGQLLDGVVERLGVGALQLQHLEQRLVALGVLLLAVLGRLRVDRPALAQLRVDELLLGLGVRDEHHRERGADLVPVRGGVTQCAQQLLEQAVVGLNQVNDIAGHRAM